MGPSWIQVPGPTFMGLGWSFQRSQPRRTGTGERTRGCQAQIAAARPQGAGPVPKALPCQPVSVVAPTWPVQVTPAGHGALGIPGASP